MIREKQTVIVLPKTDFLDAVKKNRDDHEAIFNEAIEEWRRQIAETADEIAEKARTGAPVDPFALNRIQRPVNHMSDYNRVIRMYEMDSGDVVELTESNFAQFIMDDWGWQREFLSVSNKLSGRSMSKFSDMYVEDGSGAAYA